MDLYQYIDGLTEEELGVFAKQCDTTPLYLWKLARAQRRGEHLIKEKLSSLIESNSNRLVRRWESNPHDWFVTWPELIGADGAPAVPAQQGAPA